MLSGHDTRLFVRDKNTFPGDIICFFQLLYSVIGHVTLYSDVLKLVCTQRKPMANTLYILMVDRVSTPL
jgi:hypothetical protein